MAKHTTRGGKAPLGQNFLGDSAAARAIVAAAGDLSQALVIEVGPGSGALTGELARQARRLIAIEFDRDLAPALRTRYAATPSVEVRCEDIRRVDLSAIAAQAGPGTRCVLVGNLPYYITSDILLHLVEHAAALDTAIIMVQREVAERVAAGPGSRDYGLLSVTVQMAAEAELLFTLPPEAFQPPPQVFSSVLRLRFRQRYEELQVDRMGFERFLRSCFAQKRKTLANNLKAAGFAPDEIASGLNASGESKDVRAESLPIGMLAALYRRLRAAPGLHPQTLSSRPERSEAEGPAVRS